MSDQGYIYDPLGSSDPDMLQEETYDWLKSRWSGWVPNEGNLETWTTGAWARMVSDAREVASDVPPAIFKYFGTTLMGIPVIGATTASVSSTWALVDNPAGRVIENGTLVGIEDDSGNVHLFNTVGDRELAPGVLSTGADPIGLRALETGSDDNDLGGVGIEAINTESIVWVDTITLGGITAGGGEEEDDLVYLDRLSRRLTMMSPRPIKADHYRIAAEDIAAANGAATEYLVLDGYDPATGTMNNEGILTLVGRNVDDGSNVPGGVKAIIAAELDEDRLINHVINVIDPTRTPIDVTFQIVVEDGLDTDVVTDSAVSAVGSFLSDSNWGVPSDPDQPRRWRQMPVVRHQDVSTVINNVPGVSHWTTLTIGVNGGAQAATDQSMPGAAPLAQTGVITGSHT